MVWKKYHYLGLIGLILLGAIIFFNSIFSDLIPERLSGLIGLIGIIIITISVIQMKKDKKFSK